MTNKGETNMYRNQWATTTFYASVPILTAIHSLWNASIATLPTNTQIQWIVTLQPLPVPTNVYFPNSMGIPLTPESTKLVGLEIIYTGMKAEEEEAITKVVKKLINDVENKAKALGVGSEYRYLNYATWWQDPVKGYGMESVGGLKETGKMYDPTGFFQRNCPGGFKLPK
jgi:hypothetical protein